MVLVLCVMVLTPRPAAAQGPGDTNIFGGYSYLHINDDSAGEDLQNFPAGYEVGLTHRIGTMPVTLGGKVQFSSTTIDTAQGENSDQTFDLTAFLFGVTFGPRPAAGKKVWAFGSVYVGATRATEDIGTTAGHSENSFTFQPGAGVGFALSDVVGLNVIGELPIIRNDGATTTGVRFGAQISVKLR